MCWIGLQQAATSHSQGTTCWFGGMLPLLATAVVAATGNIYAGLFRTIQVFPKDVGSAPCHSSLSSWPR
jgi:putative copper export protein